MLAGEADGLDGFNIAVIEKRKCPERQLRASFACVVAAKVFSSRPLPRGASDGVART